MFLIWESQHIVADGTNLGSSFGYTILTDHGQINAV